MDEHAWQWEAERSEVRPTTRECGNVLGVCMAMEQGRYDHGKNTVTFWNIICCPPCDDDNDDDFTSSSSTAHPFPDVACRYHPDFGVPASPAAPSGPLSSSEAKTSCIPSATRENQCRRPSAPGRALFRLECKPVGEWSSPTSGNGRYNAKSRTCHRQQPPLKPEQRKYNLYSRPSRGLPSVPAPSRYRPTLPTGSPHPMTRHSSPSTSQ